MRPWVWYYQTKKIFHLLEGLLLENLILLVENYIKKNFPTGMLGLTWPGGGGGERAMSLGVTCCCVIPLLLLLLKLVSA
jgi:hypothetical protein